MIAAGVVWTLCNLIGSIWVERRVRRLERAERERELAENSTIIRRPRRIA